MGTNNKIIFVSATDDHKEMWIGLLNPRRTRCVDNCASKLEWIDHQVAMDNTLNLLVPLCYYYAINVHLMYFINHVFTVWPYHQQRKRVHKDGGRSWLRQRHELQYSYIGYSFSASTSAQQSLVSGT